MSHNPQTFLNFGRSFLSPAIAVAALIVVVLGCGTATPPPAEYVGAWTGEDGTTMTLRANGYADYRSANTTVDNGALMVDTAAKTMKIGFVGIGPKFTIDKPPTGNQMTLSGVVYLRSGSADSKSDKTSSDSKSDSPSIKPPSDDVVQNLVKDTMLEFADAVKKDDFSHMISIGAKPFREKATQEMLHQNFKGFLETKSNFDFSPIKKMTATFSKPPWIENGAFPNALVADGYFPTAPNKTKFVFTYLNEDGEWKLIGIQVDTHKD